MGKNRGSQGCLARLVFALVGLVGLWFAVVAPQWARIDVERTTSPVLERTGTLSAGSQADRLAALSEALDAVSSRAEALRRFDEWRRSPVEVAGRTFVPWQVITERSDTARLADDAIDAALVGVSSLDAARDALDARASHVDELAAAIDALNRWPTPGRLDTAGSAAATLRADLEQLRSALDPLVTASDQLHEGLSGVSAWLDSELAAGLLGGERTRRARGAVQDLLATAASPPGQLRDAVEGLDADIDALRDAEERVARWWAPPSEPARDLTNRADPVE